MNNKIKQLNWQGTLKEMASIHAIGEEYILIEKEAFILMNRSFVSILLEHPIKVDAVTIIICTKGRYRGRINAQPYVTAAPCMTIILADQIIEYEFFSDDFEGKVIIMSKRFLESLNIKDGFSTFISVRTNPCFPLSSTLMESILGYYSMMRNTIKAVDNPHRLEIALNLTRALFYGVGYYLHQSVESETKNRNELLVDHFIKSVQLHFEKQRGVEFYAHKLSLTPKYMSTVIKVSSGRSASEWIDDRVILEVKTLLKTTHMSIQQISDQLNFPTQSSLGKYFKRLVGVSPKAYRSSIAI